MERGLQDIRTQRRECLAQIALSDIALCFAVNKKSRSRRLVIPPSHLRHAYTHIPPYEGNMPIERDNKKQWNPESSEGSDTIDPSPLVAQLVVCCDPLTFSREGMRFAVHSPSPPPFLYLSVRAH